MYLQRSAIALSRRAVATPAIQRSFTFWNPFRKTKPEDKSADKSLDKTADAPPPPKMTAFDDVKTWEDLLPPGGKPGTVPTDIEQATGLERFELLGKMQGIDVFDMKPLDASRKGTIKNPIVVRSFGDEQLAGCTGYPADSHWVKWLKMTRDRPMERCPECGGVYTMEYVGPPDDPHAHKPHRTFPVAKTFADYVRPEYRW